MKKKINMLISLGLLIFFYDIHASKKEFNLPPSLKDIIPARLYEKNAHLPTRKQQIESARIEEALKHYFLYPYFCGVLDTMNPAVVEQFKNGSLDFFSYFATRGNWNQDSECKEIMQNVLKNNEYKAICYHTILQASPLYFNSTPWINFFRLEEENSIEQFDVKEARNDININVTYDVLNLKKITFSREQQIFRLSSSVDMIYKVSGDLTRTPIFKALIEKIVKRISEEKEYKSIRFILETTKNINKKELDQTLSILKSSFENNKSALEKIKILDLTTLLYGIKTGFNDLKEQVLEIVEKKENRLPDCIVYMPKTLYLDSILSLDRVQTPGIVPYPDCSTARLTNQKNVEKITPEQLKIFLNHQCGLDLLYYVTAMIAENKLSSEIIARYGLLFTEHMSPFLVTFNNYSVLSALIEAHVDTENKNPESNNTSINLIKRIMQEYEINTSEEMHLEQLIQDTETKKTSIDLLYFLIHNEMLVPFSAKK